MSATAATPPRKFLYVYDSPRTCSQLFFKLFEKHPQLQQVWHPLMGCAVYGPEHVWQNCNCCDAAKKALGTLIANANLTTETFDIAVARLEQTIARAELEGKIAMVKDHTLCDIRQDLMARRLRELDAENHANPTFYSTEFLDRSTPIILIRHPVHAIPSCFRAQSGIFKFEAGDEGFHALASQFWVRMIFDAYHQRTNQTPIVIDAEDVLHNTEVMAEILCDRLGLEAQGVQYTWDPIPLDQQPQEPILRAFFQDIWNSAGVRHTSKPTEEHVGLDQAVARWTAEWGAETANELLRLVKVEVPSYEYLKQHKLRADAQTDSQHAQSLAGTSSVL